MNPYTPTPSKSSIGKKLSLFALATVGVLAVTYSASVEYTNYIAGRPSRKHNERFFTQWKKNEDKQYSSILEEEHRLAAFTANYDYIVKYNTDSSNTAILGLRFNQGRVQNFEIDNNSGQRHLSASCPCRNRCIHFICFSGWGTQGVVSPVMEVVSPVMDEGQYGVCGAITAALSLSSLGAINEGDLITFFA